MMEFSRWLLLISTWLITALFSKHANCYPSECVLPFPRSYVVYHLDKQESIVVDGKLDDKAWSRVSWTEDFIGDHMFLFYSLQYLVGGGGGGGGGGVFI